MTLPRRFKSREELTGEETLAQIQAERRREQAPKFETDEYKQARRDHLAEGGFEVDDEPGEKPLEEMSPAEHLTQIQKGRP